uniref:protein-glutamine gamma-glutamyltransferase n=1 Tax=Strigamia maritima TaxID=126957 RepID=T1J2C6_STRMM
MGSRCSCIMNRNQNKLPPPRLIGIELHKDENLKNHHTDKFKILENLVVRRGQDFKVTLMFDIPFDCENYLFELVFKTGSFPNLSNSTLVKLHEVHSSRDWKSRDWSVWSDSVDVVQQQSTISKQITLNITPGADAIVAEWHMEIQIFRREPYHPDNISPIVTYPVPKIFILFNPWSRLDDVYMKDEMKINEYVLNDLGKVWRGVNTSFRGMIWNYGQFENGILEASLRVLDVSPRLMRSQRGDAVTVSRELTAMVNSNDGDNGIVTGNWSGDYEGGRAPTDWQGSVEILEEWRSTGIPVNYGQCWVFAAVLTTIMRAIGIPCRTITNFESAHDTDATITHDIHVDLEGNRLEDESHDSIWNFHVWNEAWMARPDLPTGYSGWQVLDATPQERSATSGVFQTGPASVTAVRKGEVGLPYDTAFVFAEVNADKVTWLSRSIDEPLEVLNIEPNTIGQFISTKKPGQVLGGNADRRDVTHRYKAREMSLEERMTIMRAVDAAQSPARNIYHKSGHRDIKGSITIAKTPWIGDEFKIKVQIVSSSPERRTVDAIVKLESMLYTGAIHKLIKNQRITMGIEPLETREFEVTVRPREYVDKLIDQASMVTSALLIVQETRQVFPIERPFRFKLPDIDLETSDVLWVNQPNKVKVKFSNPLNMALTNGKIMIEGPGFNRHAIHHIENIKPRAAIEEYIDIIPTKNGALTMIASFCSTELRDVIGSKFINAEDSSRRVWN